MGAIEPQRRLCWLSVLGITLIPFALLLPQSPNLGFELIAIPLNLFPTSIPSSGCSRIRAFLKADPAPPPPPPGGG